jgi:hypothetical protein
MDRSARRFAAALALAAGALVVTSCEDTPLTPGEDWTIDIVAQPSVVTLDETGEAQATIVATVANDTGVPQSGVSVIFSNAGGTLASGSGGVETDGAGRAVDTLTIHGTDPDEIEVTASSGSLTDTVTVSKSTAEPNLPPVAAIQATPADEQVHGQPVRFDGSGSSDPDEGDVITVYRWRITSTDPDGATNPLEFPGAGLSSIAFPGTGPAFNNVQDLTVELSVTDDPTAPAKLALGREIVYGSTISILYKIVDTTCASNRKPTAVIAGAETQSINGNGQATVNFQLNGALSTDPEGAIDTYTWSCGNGSAAPPSSPTATCTYDVDNVTRSYTATLTVTDLGNAQGACIQTSTQDSITVVVLP